MTLGLLEQFLGGGPMGLGPLHVRFDTRDLAVQRLDPLVQLLDRKRIEVLLSKGDERIVGLAWE